MPRIGLLNMVIGFMGVVFAASGGAFVANDTARAIFDGTTTETWLMTLQRSAHGHTALFGVLHVLFGLTLPYSPLPARLKVWQTVGLSSGLMAMGPLMVWRSFGTATTDYSAVEVIIGTLLSCALLAIFSHAAGIFLKFLR